MGGASRNEFCRVFRHHDLQPKMAAGIVQNRDRP